MEQLDKSASKLQDYELGEKISFHQNREVFRARNRAGETVILKRLRMGHLSDWKAMELFEREARTLQTLSHERIPRLLDFFHDEIEGQVVLTMVMAYVEGPSLAERLKQGWRPKEAEVLEIARQGLEILSYLHGHQPAVIHRDIKPSNLIWTDAQALYLIDFGAVRDIFISKGSSTVIGTFGYMAPEQFAGQTVTGSDLYGLGATLLHLLSGRSPSEIPQKHLMPDFRPYVTCSVELQRLLEQLLVPDLEERLPDAQAALAQLKTLTKLREVSPSGRMVYVRDGEDVSIRLNPSLHPLALWRQHHRIVLSVLAYTGINGFFVTIVLQALMSHTTELTGSAFWVGFSSVYGLVSLVVLLAAVRQFARMAREQLYLGLTPTHLLLERKRPKAETLRIPRKSISQVNRRVAKLQNKLSRAGVSIKLDKALAPDLPSEPFDIAIGLGKRDQHWLMTKLLQYTYSPGNKALPEADKGEKSEKGLDQPADGPAETPAAEPIAELEAL